MSDVPSSQSSITSAFARMTLREPLIEFKSKGKRYIRVEHTENLAAESKVSPVWALGAEYVNASEPRGKHYWRCGIEHCRGKNTVCVCGKGKTPSTSSAVRYIRKAYKSV